jgi:23S rRNA pseudouridine1911/1915/1917 synthase
LSFHPVFADDHIVVADKPAGLLTIATETERERTLYVQVGQWARQKIFIVHRLDREASGLVVFARTIEAKQALQDQFKDHSAGRTYIAVAEGRVLPSRFIIRSRLNENSIHRVYVVRERGGGKPAITHVRVLENRARSSLLEVRLETGRKHQIRVHLADRGNPIVGDKLYGSGRNPIHRLALHGARLEFNHPQTGRRLSFDSPYPASFNNC